MTEIVKEIFPRPEEDAKAAAKMEERESDLNRHIRALGAEPCTLHCSPSGGEGSREGDPDSSVRGMGIDPLHRNNSPSNASLDQKLSRLELLNNKNLTKTGLAKSL
mmetsp:Transcript_37651/g.118668  ORF Transcript_37651/g.118668 Transcript_37651/m.118668 type:complete len:106 (+) Transcript_37651:743-1060(+)